ncbi:undecaprenyl-diphosphate phosphatase [Caulobacter sp. 17J65-9]|uniref:undecaprenyl-diphosphate phosphatase n=1 Tax=Caulobacter sp. 17J65-9 TaxID=2709382 RepID=UPI0013CBDADF|nr:undecaprenyl-diphosphate phosphatase [Caulobacter sp. 17J65-9]NEX93401.1 undecaprenyl-diphosphate phosphatase [Caulobacter sp. 17J65-9]
MADWLNAVILGLIEGLTEFIPVSSTGHLLLAKQALGLTDAKWDTFIVMIQLGAILAVVALYFSRLWNVLIRLPTDPQARKFVLSVTIAFIPSVVAGVFLYDFIKAVLFESPMVICIALIVGGLVLLVLERFAPKPRTEDAMHVGLGTSLGVGLFQCLAMVPGVSRSGATIVGGMALGLDKRAAAEFSFFLAIPTMMGAFVYDFYKHRDAFDADFTSLIAIGFVVSFVSGAFVVRTMLDFVAKHGFAPFAWWRILVGLVGLALIGTGVWAA